MERLPYGRYTKEFRQEAVKQVVEEGLSVHEAGKRLSIVPSCKYLNVSESGYYAWLNRRAQENARLAIEIKAAHKRMRGVYGAEKIQKELAGTNAGICRIKRIKREQGLYCKQIKKYKTTTDSAHKLSVAENLLGQEFKAETPNRI